MGVSNIHAEYALNASKIAALKSQIEELEVMQDQLKPHIIEAMIRDGVDKMETTLGKFTVTRLKKWVYPEAIVELGEELKAQKAKAESTGDATFEEVEGLRFTPIKL